MVLHYYSMCTYYIILNNPGITITVIHPLNVIAKNDGDNLLTIFFCNKLMVRDPCQYVLLRNIILNTSYNIDVNYKLVLK